MFLDRQKKESTASTELMKLARRALSDDATGTGAAALRTRGPAGLAALLAILPRQGDGVAPSRVLDAVCGQRDAHASLLFWHTDLSEARAAATALGLPILSLRMLGQLTEELSCANSRFFRTTLYPDRRVAQLLQKRFVLHWHSVRSVPRVSIDFGDGRRLVRTVTGNSAHYVLDCHGRPVDVLPGMYGADDFLRALHAALEVAQQAAPLRGRPHAELLRAHHARALQHLLGRWLAEVQGLGRPVQGAQAAFSAGALSVAGRELLAITDDETWRWLGQLHAPQLQPRAEEEVRRKMPSAFEAGRLALSKARVEMPLLEALRFLIDTVGEDSARNEYGLHRRVHEHFGGGQCPQDPGVLDEWVYGQLFLMPLDDPWLGLAPLAPFAAIDEEGKVAAVR